MAEPAHFHSRSKETPTLHVQTINRKGASGVLQAQIPSPTLRMYYTGTSAIQVSTSMATTGTRPTWPISKLCNTRGNRSVPKNYVFDCVIYMYIVQLLNDDDGGFL